MRGTLAASGRRGEAGRHGLSNQGSLGESPVRRAVRARIRRQPEDRRVRAHDDDVGKSSHTQGRLERGGGQAFDQVFIERLREADEFYKSVTPPSVSADAANVMRQALATDALDPAGVYFGTSNGSVYASRDEGETWECIARDLPAIYELIALALQTDATRVATLEIGGSFAASDLGVRKGYHNLSHHGQLQDNIDQLVQIERYQMEQFAHFLEKLRSLREPASNGTFCCPFANSSTAFAGST